MSSLSVPMESFERLEISFLSLPSVKISTSIIAPNGTEIFQSSFEGFDCPAEWVTALKAMAAAARNTHFADPYATSSPSPAILNPSQDASHSCHSSVNRSDRRRCTPAAKKPRRPQKDRQTTWPSPGDIYNQSSHFANKSDKFVTNLLPSGQESSLNVNIDKVSSPTHMIEARQQSPVALASPSTSRSIEQSHISPNIARDTEVNSPLLDSSATTSGPCSMIKRTQKLKAQLKAIKDDSIPDRNEFNDTVRRLYQHSSASSQAVTSMEQFGYLLGRLGSVSSAVGMIYSLLSWEIFRWEEERLVRDEGRARLVAAKQVNDKMAEISSRRARSKDWASDGRKAAGMVFGIITNLSTAAQSFALLILSGKYLSSTMSRYFGFILINFAEYITLDGLLKTAHFRALREHFQISFSQIVESRQKQWENLAANHYLVFDYKEVLRNGVGAQGCMISSRRSSFQQMSNQNPPMCSLPSTSRSYCTSNQQRLDVDDARDRQHNHETPPTSHRNVSDIGIIDKDFDYTLYEDFQAADLLGIPNHPQYNMDFEVYAD